MRTSAFSTSRRARTVSEPSLAQFVLLSMLLHILLVLLFGTAERGAGWRAQDLETTLAPYLPDSNYRVKVAPGAQAGGGESAPTPRPGAPREPSPTPSRRDVAPAPAVEPAPQTPQPTGASPLPEAPAIESLPSLDRGAPEIVDKAIELRREEALPRELLQETIPRVELEAPRQLEPAMEPAITPAPPVAVPRQAQPTAPPPATPRVRPPAEPKAPVAETPSPAPEAPLAAPPKIERETPPAVEPETKLAPLSPVAPPPVIAPLEEQLPRFVPETPRPLIPETTAPAPEAPPVLAPPVTTPAAPPRAERPAPRPVDQAPTAQPVPAAPAAPSASPESPRVESQRAPARDLEPARPATAPPRDAPAPEPSPRLKFGEDPDDIFKPRTSPPVGVVPPPGQAPRLKLETAKKEQGLEIAGSSARKGIFNLDAPPPEPVSKLGKAIQKAAQPDCRDAYAALGLLAVPFLVFDTVTDTGCRWR